MRKKLFGRLIGIILLYSFFICSLYADEYSDFRNLEPEQQIQKLIADYRYGGYLGIKFQQFTNILAEKPDEVKPILIEYFRRFDPPIYSDRTDRAYEILDRIILDAFLTRSGYIVIEGIEVSPITSLFTEGEKKQLAAIYQEKADYYLKTYKKIDNTLIGIEIMIHHFSDGIHITSIPDYTEWLLEKYTKLGYKDLIIVN
ncbi:hypothetical protein FACS1894110_22420 [Spirochaetia bacterium]|nr:hypothetical protein FACS1894110_22420 [Spirochaetia bacterium]